MLIEALPNDKLKTIAAKFDNGDKKLEKENKELEKELANRIDYT